MHAVMQRAHMAARGGKVEWEGVEVDPRHRFKTETILEWLEITPEEEREMITLISDDERDEKRRRAAGAVPRGEHQRLHQRGEARSHHGRRGRPPGWPAQDWRRAQREATHRRARRVPLESDPPRVRNLRGWRP